MTDRMILAALLRARRHRATVPELMAATGLCRHELYRAATAMVATGALRRWTGGRGDEVWFRTPVARDSRRRMR